MGLSLHTLQGREFGTHQPTAAAGTLLVIVEQEPEAVRRALMG